MAKTKAPTAGDGAVDPGLPQKKRARRRLVGALAVSLALAIALPLVLDSEPKRPPEDVQVQIPARDAPVVVPPAARTASSTDSQRDASGSAAQRPGEPGDAKPGVRGDQKSESKSDPKSESKAGKAEPRADAKPETRTDAKVEPKSDGKAAKPEAKADAKADAKAPATAKTESRPEASKYLLQVGAYSSEKSANDQLDKLKAAGVRAYVERVKTGQGERMRVRVGPFATRDAADKARAELKLIGVDSAVIAP